MFNVLKFIAFILFFDLGIPIYGNFKLKLGVKA